MQIKEKWIYKIVNIFISGIEDKFVLTSFLLPYLLHFSDCYLLQYRDGLFPAKLPVTLYETPTTSLVLRPTS